jgi:Outer membrane protein beta-barrel domain
MAPSKHPGMKERNIYGGEFERQLKEKSDQFKMYPSDKVWNEVYSSLHTRRRKFVIGMSFLIGGILFLAGSQLIFPTRNTPSKAVVSKIAIPAKPATAVDLHNFSTGSFSVSQADKSADRQNVPGMLNSNNTLANTLGILPDINLGADMRDESITVKTQSNARIKPIQPVETNIPEKSDEPLAMAHLNEELSAAANPLINEVSSELVSEKSASQQSHARNDRFSWEIYIAPTLNTHYLYGLNYQTMSQAIPSAPIMVVHVSNVNGFVDNTPVMGYDVGGNILYRISKNLSLKAGLEFSFSRYYIKAYNSNPGQAAAVLSSYLGYYTDSLLNLNSSATVNKNPQHYQNRYYQLSVPIGVEMKVAGRDKLQFHIGATLQPSYLLNTDAYVLTDDYNNYTKDPRAFRRWNLIAGAEAYISYGVGKIRWELGPQLRYQIFSTYKNSYFLQENMLNYGIRIGISKSIR